MATPFLRASRSLRSAQGASRCFRVPIGSWVAPVRTFTTTSTSQEHSRTGLYDFHLKNEGKMVPFGGYDMPLSYGSVGQGKYYLQDMFLNQTYKV